MFYERSPNAEMLFGAPITEAFPDPQYGGLVQYLERARFEMAVNASNGRVVRRSPLGEMVDYQSGDPLTVAVNPRACRRIEPSPHDVCYAFLDYFEEYGGSDQFGLPTTDMEIQSGRIVQRFQYAILEWHPDLEIGQQVVLSDLGMLNFNERGFNSNLLLPTEGSSSSVVHELVLHAFPEKAVVNPSATQSIYVIVLNQYLRPVSSATVHLTMRFPYEDETTLLLAPTNEHGVTMLEFPISSDSAGRVEIIATVSLPTHQEETRTSFRISSIEETISD